MNGEFTQIKNSLIFEKKLSPVDFKILVLLISYSKDNIAFPSIRTISKNLNISTKTVNKSLEKMETLEFILKENRTTSKGKKTSNCYYINEKYVVSKKEYYEKLKKKMEERKVKIELFDYDWLNEGE